jgi:hypothetical protein
MGLTFSTPLEENSVPTNQSKNIETLANVQENNILDTLNISEFNTQIKTQMPLVGGNDYTSEGDFAYNYPQVSNRIERYNNYDLFDVMTKLEAKNNIVGGNVNEHEISQTTSSNHGMDAIKSIILEEINNYKKNKLNNESDNHVGGGDCGCSGENKVLEGGRKKKNKKSKKVMKGGISSSSSESSFNNYKVNREEIVDASSNEELEEKGLSIFPLNSSDVSNQTSSERNFRMLRRKM